MDYEFMYFVMAAFLAIMTGLLIGILTGFCIGIYKEKHSIKKKRIKRRRREKKEKRTIPGKDHAGRKKRKERNILSKRVHTHDSYINFLCNDDKQLASDCIRKARKAQEKSYKSASPP